MSLDSESNELFDHRDCAQVQQWHNNNNIDTSLLDIDDDDEPHAKQRRTDGFQIFVKTLNGKTMVFRTHTTDTILHIQMLMWLKTGAPPDAQRLYSGMFSLHHSRTMGDYGLREGSTIQVLLRLRGGGGGDDGVETPAAKKAR